MPRKPRLKIPNFTNTLPGRAKDTKFMFALKNHLEQANEATNLQDAKNHIQAVLTMIGFHNIKLSSKSLIEVLQEIENGVCIINGCKVGILSGEYDLSVDEKTTMTIQFFKIDED